MNAKDRRRLRRRKRRIGRRLDRNNFPREPGPVFKASNVRYEVSDRIRAPPAGGVAAAHMLAVRLGLPAAINKRLRLLKRHAPYYESDHVLNIPGAARRRTLVGRATTTTKDLTAEDAEVAENSRRQGNGWKAGASPTARPHGVGRSPRSLRSLR